VNQFSLIDVVNLICKNEIFHNRFTANQTSVEKQLQYALFRLDHDNSEANFLQQRSFEKCQKKAYLIASNEFVKSLCRLKNNFVKWLNTKAKTKESLINDIRQKEFIEIIYQVDEINIVLSIKFDDQYDDELFCNRKTKYAMNLYAVCDSNRRVIYFLCD
jgi:hypothetical protein